MYHQDEGRIEVSAPMLSKQTEAGKYILKPVVPGTVLGSSLRRILQCQPHVVQICSTWWRAWSLAGQIVVRILALHIDYSCCNDNGKKGYCLHDVGDDYSGLMVFREISIGEKWKMAPNVPIFWTFSWNWKGSSWTRMWRVLKRCAFQEMRDRQQHDTALL